MKQRSPYETIIVLTGACIVLFLFTHQRYWLWIGLSLILLSLLSPFLADLIHKGWYRIGEAIGAVTGKIILTMVYLIFVLPLAFLFRKKHSINLRTKKQSYFRERDHQYTGKDMENVW